jgi:F-type H+-transporting ATPase subunit b
MQIDWFTVVAQVINFLILVYLLKRFLYAPIIDAMDKRQRMVAARMQEAEEKSTDAEQQAQHYRDLRRELDERRSAEIAQAKEDAQSQRAVLMDELRAEVTATGQRWRDDVEREKNAFLRELRQQIEKQVSAIARRALRDLADVELEQQIVRIFLGRLRDLHNTDKQELADTARAAKRLSVASSFDIPVSLRQQMIKQIHEAIAADIDVQFEQSADLLCGIALLTPGRKIMWSIDSYLEGIEDALGAIIDASRQQAQAV